MRELNRNDVTKRRMAAHAVTGPVERIVNENPLTPDIDTVENVAGFLWAIFHRMERSHREKSS